MSGRFKDKTILITGASSGIGASCAERVAREGGRLLLVGRNESALKTISEKLSGKGHLYFSCDATSDASVDLFSKQLTDNKIKVDGMVLAAGSHLVRPFQLSKTEHFEKLFRDNVITAMNFAKLASKLRADNGLSLILFSSVSALRSSAGVSCYAAAKGALLSLTHSLAEELASKNIRVNVVLPGVVNTPMSEKFFSTLTNEAVSTITKKHLLGLGQPEDVSNVVTFLLSDESRWVTGSRFVIDGGLSNG